VILGNEAINAWRRLFSIFVSGLMEFLLGVGIACGIGYIMWIEFLRGSDAHVVSRVGLCFIIAIYLMDCLTSVLKRWYERTCE
jgi:hypothetical protein